MSQSAGVPYYFRASVNGEAHEARWDPPPGMSEEQVNALPGASEYLRGGAKSQRSDEDSMRASQLVKHSDSSRPSSRREVRPIPHRIETDLA
jgi:peptidyl-prolyl cis-trans isomerase NIMA-interacting 1